MALLKKYFWLVFLLLTLALRACFHAFPGFTEQLYSRGIFQGIRYGLDFLTGWLPFPFTYVLFAGLIWWGARAIRSIFVSRTDSLGRRLLQAGRRVILFGCAVVALFYWLWGFNYDRISIEQQLALPEVHPDSADIKAALDEQTQRVLQLRLTLQPDTSKAIDTAFPADQLETAVRQEVIVQLAALHFPTPGSPRGRQPFWKGFLLRFGAAGIYNPFSGECNIDRALHPLTKPINLAHELCHGYGFGDEGTCNFLAYLALEKSQQPYLRYTAELDFWRELAIAYRQSAPEAYPAFRATLPTGFRSDLDNIYRILDQYPEFFEAFRYQLYDQYLKSQGISEGMANYGKVIPLVLAWRQRG
ncbi:MAG: DUF3810 domain-containing protein [Bacteroidetes bacterium]|nr:DUF3810 domain-containing protein [Bacteroidota bacterium]